MEGSKNAMYSQAGRSRGWSQGVQPVVPAPAVPVPTVPVPTVPVPAIPEPPLVVLPIRPIAEAPAAELPLQPAAEPPAVIMSATVEAELNTMYVTPEPERVFEECETPVMAYVPMQRWGDLYEPEQGISRGTIFAKLDLPFIGEGACRYE